MNHSENWKCGRCDTFEETKTKKPFKSKYFWIGTYQMNSSNTNTRIIDVFAVNLMNKMCAQYLPFSIEHIFIQKKIFKKRYTKYSIKLKKNRSRIR